MNPSEISDALSELAAQPYDAGEFPFVFAQAPGTHRRRSPSSGAAASISRTCPAGS
jgi:hypothetical protein